jgi:hypothetical protein
MPRSTHSKSCRHLVLDDLIHSTLGEGYLLLFYLSKYREDDFPWTCSSGDLLDVFLVILWRSSAGRIEAN